MYTPLKWISPIAVALLPSAAPAQLTSAIAPGDTTIYLDNTTDAGSAALDMAVPAGESGRMFFVTQGGIVRLYRPGDAGTSQYVNIASHVSLISTGERGLLGMAFHPDFNAPAGTPGRGKFFTHTSETHAGNADFSHPEIGLAGGDHHSVIREWSVDPAANTPAAPTSRVLMRIAQPQANHNGGAVRFGNDGMLYLSLGDGGGGNDNSGGISATNDGHTNGTGNAQDISNVYGKVLRINPFGTNSANGDYGIPADNPFTGASAGVDEIFAFGLRNPFRMNFDRLSGRLYVGDVGQGAREEVDIITSGGNYGWVYMEGSRVNRALPSDFTSVAPVGEYTSGDGHSVIGGFVYRGSIPELQGRYVFGDYNGNAGLGRLFHMPADGGTISEFRYTGPNRVGSLLYGWGEDSQNELYAMFADGTVKRILGTNQWRPVSGGSWETAGNWTSSVPDAAGASARFLNGPVQPATVTLSSPKTVGFLTFSNANRYTIAGASTLTLNGGAVRAEVHVRNGSHTIATPLAMTSDTLLNVAPAASVLTVSGNFNATGVDVLKTGAGRVDVDSIRAGHLGIAQGRMRVLPNGGSSGVSTLDSLVIDSAGTLDLSDNDLLINYTGQSPYHVLRGFVVDGRDGSGGIVTTQTQDRTLALAEAAELRVTSWLGREVDTDTIIGKHTYYGDANFDGKVTGDDYVAVDANLGTGTMWTQGDFSQDGRVSGDDYVAIDSNLGKGTADPAALAALKAEMIALHAEMFGETYLSRLAQAEAEGFGALVPEPGMPALLGTAAALLARRRRRTS
jgi:hypothetical protein